ncbi:adenosylcobinamide-GDP ribazoletransferase [Granulicella rosea]|uniref:adenosylcobinamide-GDP ribazoletransferase n=1 Tax=Granulicella rosea TaxID=474952 RepID=UPI000B782C1A|nr:adenosylcobinamide-GDP ribazoletransferase [Granulicella rosea]
MRHGLSLWHDLLSATQFLTRIPVPSPPYDEGSLSRAVKFFPIVGLVVGVLAAVLHRIFALHLSRPAAASLTLTFLVLITGCFHEDALADVADGFGGGWHREQVLAILKDSRIGAYGGAALALSLLARLTLIASLPLAHVAQYLIAAHVLCRWTTLPLSYLMADARAGAQGQGSRIAKLTTAGTLVFGTVTAFAIAIYALRMQAAAPILAAIAVTALSGLYYRRRIQGVTGDCFGATNQLTEIAVYLCGAWVL